jgi:hypothetical protein
LHGCDNVFSYMVSQQTSGLLSRQVAKVIENQGFSIHEDHTTR